MVKVSLADAPGGLLIAVPNGWLFQVMPASVQVAVGRKMSTVRQVAAIPVTYMRSVASRTVAVEAIDGTHRVRSKRMYSRRLSPLALATSFVVPVPKLLVGEPCRTDESMIDVSVAGAAVRAQVPYGVNAWEA